MELSNLSEGPLSWGVWGWGPLQGTLTRPRQGRPGPCCCHPGPCSRHRTAGWGSRQSGREPGTGCPSLLPSPTTTLLPPHGHAEPLAQGRPTGGRTRSSEPGAAQPGAPDPRVGQQPPGLNFPTVKGPCLTTPQPTNTFRKPPASQGARVSSAPAGLQTSRLSLWGWGKPGEK